MLVLVLGAAGMLGRDVVKTLSDQGIPHLAYNRKLLDIKDEMGLHRVMRANKIDLAINCAAFTDVPRAEEDITLAKDINGFALGILSRVCHSNSVKLIHFSTDYVFDGCKEGAYVEDEEARPLNVYGKSKLIGEEEIKNNCEDYKIFRLQWLYGKHGSNFVNKIIELYNKHGRISIVEDQFGSPCSTEFIAKTLITVLDRWDEAPAGIYHLTHDDYCSWNEFATYIFSQFDKQDCVHAIKAKDLKSRVVRPDNCVMDNTKFKNNFREQTLGSWKHDVDNFLVRNPEVVGKIIETKKLKLRL